MSYPPYLGLLGSDGKVLMLTQSPVLWSLESPGDVEKWLQNVGCVTKLSLQSHQLLTSSEHSLGRGRLWDCPDVWP